MRVASEFPSRPIGWSFAFIADRKRLFMKPINNNSAEYRTARDRAD